jgi:S1-C subfamily serine protease
MTSSAKAMTLIVALEIVGCRRSVTPELWATKPHSEWPQLVLTNDAQFNDHTALQGASAFLVRADDGRVLAATASHLIGAAGGVEPQIAIAELDQAIRRWTMFPRTMRDREVEVGGIAADDLDAPDLDWLVLTIKNAPSSLPATPLKIRSEPAQIEEEVLLVGCPYSERRCVQNVYAGKITARQDDRFRYDIAPPVDIHGFSGAPIVDRNGYLVGVMTVWFDARKDGEKYLEAGGEDAAPMVRRIRKTL